MHITYLRSSFGLQLPINTFVALEDPPHGFENSLIGLIISFELDRDFCEVRFPKFFNNTRLYLDLNAGARKPNLFQSHIAAIRLVIDIEVIRAVFEPRLDRS